MNEKFANRAVQQKSGTEVSTLSTADLYAGNTAALHEPTSTMETRQRSGSYVLFTTLVLATLAAPRLAVAAPYSEYSAISLAQQSTDEGHGPKGSSPRPPRGPGQAGPPRPAPAPSPQPGRPRPPAQSPSRPPAHFPVRPPRYHQPHHGTLPGYAWGGGSGWRLRQFFLGVRPRMGVAHRHHFYVGGFFPFNYMAYMQPIPHDLMVYLPPIPVGYDVGYYDGYCLVYDPQTLQIISVIDLDRY